MFSDTVNRMMPKHHRDLGLKVSTSNLCSEITLPTGIDHLGNDRTAVCCLSSLNLETWEEWNGDKQFIEDVMRFLDNVLQDYIDRAPDEMARAKYSASRERSVGPRGDGLPFVPADEEHRDGKRDGQGRQPEDVQAYPRARIRCLDAAGAGARALPRCRRHGRDGAVQLQDGDRADRVDQHHLRRHLGLHRADPGQYLHPQDPVGQLHRQRTPIWKKLLDKKAKNSNNVWNSILERGGSVQHLDFPHAGEKRRPSRPASKSHQRWLLEFAADRTPYIDQAQSLNLFIPADVDKWDLMMLHFQAWEKGIKSLYYLRSKSVQRAGFVGGVEPDNTSELAKIELNAGDQDRLRGMPELPIG